MSDLKKAFTVAKKDGFLGSFLDLDVLELFPLDDDDDDLLFFPDDACSGINQKKNRNK